VRVGVGMARNIANFNSTSKCSYLQKRDRRSIVEPVYYGASCRLGAKAVTEEIFVSAEGCRDVSHWHRFFTLDLCNVGFASMISCYLTYTLLASGSRHGKKYY
jgi:hypothetical protein